MNLIFIILWSILLFYLILYLLYDLILIYNASRGRVRDIIRKNIKSQVQRHITIIVYAQQSSDSLIHLVGLLQQQDYPKDRYSINVLLDNPSDCADKVLELIDGINVWKLNSPGYSIGMFPAVGRFINKCMASEYTNAFVLLSPSSIVKPNFIERVNSAVEKDDISQACIATTSPFSTPSNTSGYIQNRINMRVINAGKFHLGLSSSIFSTGLIASQEFFEKFPIDLEPFDNELDYYFNLLSKNIKINWAPEVIVYNKIAEDIYDLSYWIAEKTYKDLKAIIKNFKKVIFNKNCLSEALYILKPAKSIIFFICLVLIILGYLASVKFQNVDLWLYIPIILFLSFIGKEFICLNVAKCSKKEKILWLNSFFRYFKTTAVSFVYFLRLSNFKSIYDNIFNKPSKEEFYEFEKTYKSEIINVIVTDGNKNIKCQLEIIADKWNNQLVLIFNNKKFTTKVYRSMDQAFDEINNKLVTKNFRLVTCYNCGYFSYSNKSHKDSYGTSGHCFEGKEGQQLHYDEIVKTWQVCQLYRFVEERNEIIENWKKSLAGQDTSI
ncbi:MAG: hypothetical protein AB1782_06625 [Cyanobacteriota bacterium]